MSDIKPATDAEIDEIETQIRDMAEAGYPMGLVHAKAPQVLSFIARIHQDAAELERLRGVTPQPWPDGLTPRRSHWRCRSP